MKFRELVSLYGVGHPNVERAQKCLIDCVMSFDWYENVYDLWKKALESIGFTEPEISFSGFGCQGDGASFTSGLEPSLLLEFMGSNIKPSLVIASSRRAGGEEDFWPWVRAKAHQFQPWDHRYLWLSLVADVHIVGGVYRNDQHYVHPHSCSFTAEMTVLENEGEWVDEGPTKWHWQPRHGIVSHVFGNWVKDVESLRLVLCDRIYTQLEVEQEYIRSIEYLIEHADANNFIFDLSGEQVAPLT